MQPFDQRTQSASAEKVGLLDTHRQHTSTRDAIRGAGELSLAGRSFKDAMT